MIDKLLKGLEDMKITTADLESAERLFRFLADTIKETRVELEIQGYDNELEKLIRDRQIIPAIKLYRTKVPGMGLKEAKDAVEAMGEKLGVFKDRSWGRV
jgi:hypothetical protein